jgi:hypothetical protein
MPYTDFSLDKLKSDFHLTIAQDQRLFAALAPVEIPAALASLLEDNVPLALAIDTEKARSEFIIAPVLAACRAKLKDRISLFSGIEFNVDADRGLNGVCDFLISATPEQFYVTAPVIVLIEAKNNRIKEGLPQCIAAMVAARIFNEQKGNAVPAIHGVVTTGSLWRFLRLVGDTASLDRDEYHIREINKIFSVLLAMSGQQRENAPG